MRSMKNSYIIANWKMNPGALREAENLVAGIVKNIRTITKATVVIAPPSIYLYPLQKKVGKKIKLAAQDCHFESDGAYTGELSPRMLKNAGATYVILGHSEQRTAGETSAEVNEKIKAVLKVGLMPIVCIGETKRDAEHQYLSFLETQVKETFNGIPLASFSKIFIAYEPLWAIGENATREATPEECREIVIYIKRVLTDMYGAKSTSKIKILYGGSVDESNARMMLEEGGVQGLLVGRASLKPKQFIKLIEATAFYNENNKTNW